MSNHDMIRRGDVARLCDDATADYSRKMAEPGGLSDWAEMNAKREAVKELATAIRALSAQVQPAPVAEVRAEAVAGAVAQMREALRKLGVIPGKVWMMLEEIDSDAAQEALDRIRAEARAPLEAQIAALTAKLEAAEAKVGRLVEAVKLVKAHAQTQMRTADFHATGCQCWRCAEDEMFAALAEIGGGNG